MTFLLAIPAGRITPLDWVAGIVFGEILGLQFQITEAMDPQTVLSFDGRRLVMPSLFPDLAEDRSQWAGLVPEPPLATLDTAVMPEADIEEPLPVLFGQTSIAIAEREILCGIDILGSIFFMLSRYEEIALPDRDVHDRFPATASLAWKGGFLYRPVVDEYAELLWVLMKRLWPGLTRRRREGRVRVSCDVDQPFDRVGTSPKALLRSLAGDLGRRGDPALALRRMRNFIAHRKGDYRFDPYYTFDWYMDVCERNGHRAAFYFIADHSAGSIDGTYEIDEPRVLDLLRKIADRGHEIGMHGSYNTFRDASQIARERSRLASACYNVGLEVALEGNRQHYLRWDVAETPDHLDAAGFSYDTTGSFADRPGFRHGTSRPFPMWSWRNNAPSRLRQAPLVLMECSVMSKSYLGLQHSEAAFDLMMRLKSRALKYGGDFTLLWHNSELLTRKDRAFVEGLLC